MSEARSLLEKVPHAYKCSTYDEGVDVPVDDSRCDCHRKAIDAYLAQPITKCGSSEEINRCACDAQVCARCGVCRKEARRYSLGCWSLGRATDKRHIWKWTPEEESP
ncbi:hypothetical protein LCGC14_1341620 [marine sediment metagenome]|uniref:Uncharacterized protein n=1 Tax=marine sediment metagenome TaxID=412755 RepID=A0A0F9NFS8_9ZZZZ